MEWAYIQWLVPLKEKRHLDTTQRTECHVKMEAEIGVRCLQAKESRRGNERIFGGSVALLTPPSYITLSAIRLWFEEKLLPPLLCLRSALSQDSPLLLI